MCIKATWVKDMVGWKSSDAQTPFNPSLAIQYSMSLLVSVAISRSTAKRNIDACGELALSTGGMPNCLQTMFQSFDLYDVQRLGFGPKP